MSPFLDRSVLVVLTLASALALSPAQPERKGPDPADDPLPLGAKVRYGVTRPILRTGPGVALLPPGYSNFLAPTMSGGVRQYDLGTGRPLKKAVDAGMLISPGQVHASADGKRAAVARPGSLTVVEVATSKQLLAVQPPEGVIIVGTPGASLSEDGRILAYGGRGREGKGEVVVWNVDDNEQVARVETIQASPVYPLLSRDGKTLATHGPPLPAPRLRDPNAAPEPKEPAPKIDPDEARTAQVWDVESGKELFRARVTGMGGMAVASAFAADGNLLALASGDGPVDLWDVKTGKRLHTLLGRKGQAVRVAISPDGKTVASVGPDYRIQRWSTDGKSLGVTDAPPGILIAPITGLTFADNDRAIAWITAAQFCVAWEAPSGRLLSPLMDHQAAIRSISFPPEERDLFSSGSDGRVFRWDRPTGLLNEMVQLHPARLPGQPLIRPVVTMSADARRATWLRNPAEVFDMANGSDLFVVPPPSSASAPVSFILSPDGMKVITISRQADDKRSGSCVVWDLATQKRVAEFPVPSSPTGGPPGGAMSRDGSRLVLITATRNAVGRQVFMVIGYDLTTGKKLAEVEDPAASGTMSVVAADDTHAVLVSSNGRLWSVDYVNGKVGPDIDKLPLRGEAHQSPVAFSSDGRRFATGVIGEEFETYGVRVYDWATRKAVHTFVGHAGPVSALRFSPDGRFLATGAQDTSVLSWDLSRLAEKDK
jgi:WD40 repeat protein